MSEDKRSNATKRIARRVEKGETIGWEKLESIDSVSSKKEAITHLKKNNVDTEALKYLKDNTARKTIDILAGNHGYIYPNYRPL